MTNRTLSLFVTVCLAGLFLSACDETSTPKNAKLPASKSAAVKTIPSDQTAVEESVASAYVYDPTDTRDPFQNPFGKIIELPVDNSIPLTPLQKFDLEQLRVIGIIIGKGESRAMVIAPDNKSFILKKGIKVGRNNGTVINITTETIMVEEQYVDFSGDIKTNVQEIRLPKQGGEK